MAKEVQNYNKYENYIRIGHNGTKQPDGSYTCSDLQDFPTPATLHRALHDVDKDAFTDLQGYTHRNRVRHDVEDIEVSFPILSDVDAQYILNRISPEWIYVELIDKKTGQKKIHKMYASDKEWDTFLIFKDNQNNWHTEDVDLTFSLIEQ
jgi:hypothetical protein